MPRLPGGRGAELEEGWKKDDGTMTREGFEVQREARRRKQEAKRSA